MLLKLFRINEESDLDRWFRADLQCVDLGQGVLHICLRCLMGLDYDADRLILLAAFLDNGFDGNGMFAEDAGDGGEDPRFIEGGDPEIIGAAAARSSG